MSDICTDCGVPKPENTDDLCRRCTDVQTGAIAECEDCGDDFIPRDSDQIRCRQCEGDRRDDERLRGGLYRSAI